MTEIADNYADEVVRLNALVKRQAAEIEDLKKKLLNNQLIFSNHSNFVENWVPMHRGGINNNNNNVEAPNTRSNEAEASGSSSRAEASGSSRRESKRFRRAPDHFDS